MTYQFYAAMIRPSLLQQTKLNVLLSSLLRNKLSQKHKTKSQSLCAQDSKYILEEDCVLAKESKTIIQKLDVEKAYEPDSVPARVLKLAAPELAKPLAKLFQLCFTKETMPKKWKVGHVISCHEKKDMHDPNNYRPVLLLSITSNGMERLLNSAIWKYVCRHNLISDIHFITATRCL